MTRTQFQSTIAKHSPDLLIGFGLAGMAFSVIFAVKATPKATELLEEKKEELETEKLPRVEIVKTAGLCYLPTVVLFSLSTACILGANTVHARRHAALAAAYSLSETAFKEYSDKVKEELGKNKEQKIRDGIAKDKVQKDPVENREVILTGNGDSLCYDSISGRYFKTGIDKLQKIENQLNKRMLSDMFVSLNDFYYEAGLEPLKGTGDDLGWNVERGLIDLGFSSQIATDGTPCLVLLYRTAPQYGYQNFG